LLANSGGVRLLIEVAVVRCCLDAPVLNESCAHDRFEPWRMSAVESFSIIERL